MKRFPMLTTYGRLLQLAAVIIILIGVLMGIGFAAENADKEWNSETREYEDGFDLFTFIAALVFTGSIALSLLIQAELIQLGLAIETHLYHMYNILASQTDKSTSIRS